MQIKNTVRLYNTLSHEIEDFMPLVDKKVGLYACGPTVYDFAHIGHIRRYILDDVLVRLLRYLAYDVTHVMNITDVGHLTSDADTGEDKMEKGARREGKTAWEVAKFYEDYFFQTMAQVLVKKPNVVCRATDHIQEQIKLVKKLEVKGYTYQIPDGVYFDISKFPNYSKLAGQDLKAKKAGVRVEEIPSKKHPADFALWKFTPSGARRDMEWDSPWGKGFPGWHIECSAMSMKYLSDSFDIHTAGIDHIPIHSPNEIAQSEAATGKQFVKYWIHHNFVLVDGQKMSKSLDNFIKLEEVKAKGFEPLALRLLFLQTHYRQESNFTWEALAAAQVALKQLASNFLTIKTQVRQPERVVLSHEKLQKVNILRKKFKDVIRLDLNTPQAVGVMWEIVKSNIPNADKYDLLQICDEILGLGLESHEAQNIEVPEAIKLLVQKREDLRKSGKYEDGDELRKQIEDQGFLIEDSSAGPIIKKK